MSAPTALHRYTYRDYLALEEASHVKHEYLDGEIYGMAGGTPAHAALAVAISSSLHLQLRGGPGRVYSSDLRVRAMRSGLATYPDVTVICGELESDPDSATTIVNPTVVVEVLSDSTEDYDRGKKLEHYRSIPSMAAVVLASHRTPRLETWHQEGGAWQQEAASSGETLRLSVIEATIEVDEVYRGIALEPAGSPEPGSGR
ncbi:MAG TPA: Uma2 family endonuclease [Thermoanaerobaculia bacterium]|nr:Uma2 family endonuclease [Thermoanaerobaculia bacterium]